MTWLSAAVFIRSSLPIHETKASAVFLAADVAKDRKSTRLNSSHDQISYAVFCLKKKTHSRSSAATVKPSWPRCGYRGGPGRPIVSGSQLGAPTVARPVDESPLSSPVVYPVSSDF